MKAKNLVNIIVNKHFEVEPFVAALMAMNREHNSFPMPTQLNIPTDGVDRMKIPRASYRSDEMSFDLDVWCVEDLMDKDANGSSSEEKWNVLPSFFYDVFNTAGNMASLVISVSTAESTPEIQGGDPDKSINGSVIFGGKFFMFDVHSMGTSDPDPESGSYLEIGEPYLAQEIPALYQLITKISEAAQKKMWMQANSPANNLLCSGSSDYLSVGVVNVTHYEAYEVADPAAYEAAKVAVNTDTPVCIETTHGIVNSAVKNACSKLKMEPLPVVFASPITDRYKHFDDDVGSSGLQNYIAGYNAGIAVGHLLVALNEYYGRTAT